MLWDELSERELLDRIDRERLPCHVAVIMDGNRRWARKRHLPVAFGHKEGVNAFRRVMETSRTLGIKYLTAYAFSAENWQRSKTEVTLLMQLFEYYVKAERDNMMRNGIRFRCIGKVDSLPQAVCRELRKTEEITADNKDMTLNLAVNYGGRDEIVEAARQLAARAVSGEIRAEDIDEAALASSLWTAGQPDPDLLIRTSGELRISNFLLWQAAYTEFWFSDILWPDVDAKTVYRAVLEYQQRERRKGA
ncbi:isoprenyl transferase [bacterium]|nr:isoprenyl transferase [bacterium]